MDLIRITSVQVYDKGRLVQEVPLSITIPKSEFKTAKRLLKRHYGREISLLYAKSFSTSGSLREQKN